MTLRWWVEYSDTHRLIFIISPFLTLHDGAVDVGNNCLRIRDVALKLGNYDVGVGNDCMGVRDIMADIRNDGLVGQNITMDAGNSRICVYCKFGLEADGQRGSCGSDRTHIEHMKDPIEVRPPCRDRLFIVLCVEHSRDTASLTPLDDVLLDLRHSSTIVNPVSGSPGVCITGPTYKVNCPIASKTD